MSGDDGPLLSGGDGSHQSYRDGEEPLLSVPTSYRGDDIDRPKVKFSVGQYLIKKNPLLVLFDLTQQISLQ